MTLPLILAIEPDAGQASRLASIARGLNAELVLADAADRALAALGNRVPDVILTPALLLPKDEAALADRLRQLGDRAAHVQTLTIPMFATGAKPARTGGMLSALRRHKTRAAEPDGCDPDVFAEQVAAYTARAAKERSGHPGAAAEALEEQRIGEEAQAAAEFRIAEERRLAEEARAAKAHRLAQEARVAEERRIAEERRLAEEARAAEELRIAEERRLAEEARAAEELRIAEERRLAEEARAAEQRRLAEEARAAEELRIAGERRLAEEARAAEQRRLAEEVRVAEERRLAEEARAAEELRIAEERRLAEEARAAEQRRLAEEARLAEEVRAAEERRIAEQRRLAEEARAAEALANPAESETRDWIAVDLAEPGPAEPIRPSRVHTKPAKNRKKKPDHPRRPQQGAQDEWSFFDPNHVRFAALLAKLDEISRAGQPSRSDRR